MTVVLWWETNYVDIFFLVRPFGVAILTQIEASVFSPFVFEAASVNSEHLFGLFVAREEEKQRMSEALFAVWTAFCTCRSFYVADTHPTIGFE